MNAKRLTVVLAGVFAAAAALLGLLALTVTPVAALIALPFAVAAYLLWFHAIDRVEAQLRGEHRRRARASVDAAVGGAHPDDVAAGAGTDGRRGDGGQSAGQRRRAESRRRRAREGDTDPGAGAGRTRVPPREEEPVLSRAAARELLGVQPDADTATLRSAYRERAKELHPDQGGDEEAFRRVTRAYQLLRTDR